MSDVVACTRRAQEGKPPLEISERACGLSWLAAKSGNPATHGTSIEDCRGCEIGQKNSAGLDEPNVSRRKAPTFIKPGSNAPLKKGDAVTEKDEPMAREKKAKSGSWTCDCGKVYGSYSGLYGHKKKCQGQRAADQRDAGPDGGEQVKRSYTRKASPGRSSLAQPLLSVSLNEAASLGELFARFPELREIVTAHIQENV